jgi:hypothetical protein
MTCEKDVRAHSIQNAGVFDRIADNQHLMALRPKFSAAGPELAWQSVSRHQASTFTGLCNEHDTALFRPLDTRPL